jgi:crossover junction endodeoxyribonuclease RusA
MSELVRIAFSVLGEPKPQGSKKAHPVYGRDGKPVMKHGRMLLVMREDNPEAPAWRQEIKTELNRTYPGPGLLDGPLSLRVLFLRPRPRRHYGTGRNAGTLKPSAPPFPTTKPDNSKLVRAIEDALTGVLWTDDARVVWREDLKLWGPRYETRIVVEEIDPRADIRPDWWPGLKRDESNQWLLETKT